ncbi:MAG: PEGA domain-containing protein [Deltaproteobacteria bacterium]|nr:PEGA domain-containing protein [Deltaproteobacteria bacterium]
MRRRIAMLGCVTAVVLCSAAQARADVTVLGLRSLEGDEALAERVTALLRQFIVSRGLDTVSERSQTLEQMLLLAENCGEDVDSACMREIAEMLGADEVVYGFIARMPGEDGRFTYAIDVRRYSTESHRDLESASGSLEPNRQGTANLQILANTMLDTLWDRQAETTLIVQSNQPDAAVYLDGDLVGHTGAEPLWLGDVAAGEHEVLVEKEGFDPWERLVDVADGQYRLLEAPLTSEGGTAVAVGPGPDEGGGTEPPPPLPPPGGEEEGEGGIWSDWHFWAGVGSVAAGIGLAGGGLGLSLGISDMQDDPQFVNYRRAHPTSADVCQDAKDDLAAGYIRDICDTADTYQIVQFVLYGLGAAAAGVGIYFLVVTDWDGEAEEGTGEPETALALTPLAIFGGGGVGLSGTF